MQPKVLIIEDREDDALLVVRFLKNCGIEPRWQRVDRKADLAEAVESRRWDLVICDLAMPKLTAFAAADCVRQVNPDIPIIVVTGHAPQDMVGRLIQHGIHDIVLKDDLPRLNVAVRRALALAQNRREKAAAELLLATAIETLEQGIALYDADARLIACNTRYRQTMDRCEQDIVPGVAYSDLLRLGLERGQFAFSDAPGETQERLLAYRLYTDEPFEQRQHDGRWIKVRRNRTPSDGIITVTTDITEDKRRQAALIDQAEVLSRINGDLIEEIRRREAIEQALRESENRARAIFESAVDGVVSFNADGLIETLNPAAEAIFGYAAGELAGRHIHHLMLLGASGTDAPADRGHPEPRLVTGWRRNGETFPAELTVSPVALRDRVIYTGIVRDVTERTRLDRLKNEFIAMVGHELRTPLTAIRGSLALLNHGVAGSLPDRARSMVAIGYEHSERLLQLIGDILDIEKIEAGKLQFSFAPVGVEALVESAIHAHRALFDRCKLTLNTEHQAAADATIRADAQRLRQALYNLFSNAAKYSPPGGTVTVGTRAAHGTARIWVADQGPGIPDEYRAAIFEKFSQADSSDTRPKGGTGLGLSIAKAIVERHGGAIGFEAAEGGGARFFVDLPLFLEKTAPQLPGKAPPNARRGADDWPAAPGARRIRSTTSNAS